MKPTVFTLSVVLLGGLVALAGTGCGVTYATATPVVAVAVSRPAPPARVYYGGRWLQYRDTSYQYYDRGHWVVASSVPAYVSSYHRPVHVARRTHTTTTRVRRSPTHVRRSPTHVSRTSRTYRRAPPHRRR